MTRSSRGAAYDARVAALAATGRHMHGEADLVASLHPASVLDAGCGTGRVAVELARRGYEVVGVDRDADMLAAASLKAPALEWHLADLAHLELRDADGQRRRFDCVLLAGNVMIFLSPGTEAAVVQRLAGHLRPGGVLVAGFELRPAGLTLQAYDEMGAAAGLVLLDRWATWDRTPCYEGGTYAVSVHGVPLCPR